jgi:hypothetical protein
LIKAKYNYAKINKNMSNSKDFKYWNKECEILKNDFNEIVIKYHNAICDYQNIKIQIFNIKTEPKLNIIFQQNLL